MCTEMAEQSFIEENYVGLKDISLAVLSDFLSGGRRKSVRVFVI